jgi:hypothetical protein
MRAVIGLVVATALCASCVQNDTYQDVLSSRPLEPEYLGRLVRLPTSSEGDSSMVLLLVALPIGLIHHPSVDAALRDAIGTVPGAVALAEVDINFEMLMIPPLWVHARYRVRGFPLVEPAQGAAVEAK